MLHQNAEWIAHTVRWLKYWLLTCWGLKCLMFDHFLSLLHQNAAEWITRSVRCWPCQSCAWSRQPVGNHGGPLHSLHHPHIIILYYIIFTIVIYYCYILLLYIIIRQAVGNHGGQLHSLHHPRIVMKIWWTWQYITYIYHCHLGSNAMKICNT